MISKDLKEVLNLAGGRYIIVENGKPAYIVMSFEDYKEAVLNRKKELRGLTEKELIDKINSDISLWRESQVDSAEGLLGEIEKLEDIEYVK
jgi:PHD/YefM family antitoxin component YafN of YafNO toxin-antitoxin module